MHGEGETSDFLNNHNKNFLVIQWMSYDVDDNNHCWLLPEYTLCWKPNGIFREKTFLENRSVQEKLDDADKKNISGSICHFFNSHIHMNLNATC